MLHIMTSTGDELFSGIDIDDLEWPWTLQNRGLRNGWKLDQDNLQTGTAKRLSRFSWVLLKLLVKHLRC